MELTHFNNFCEKSIKFFKQISRQKLFSIKQQSFITEQTKETEYSFQNKKIKKRNETLKRTPTC